MPQIIADNHTIYYEYLNEEKAGPDKPLLVFLHEGLGSILQWKDFPMALCEATGLAALVYDRYGYGRSQAIDKPAQDNYLDHEGRIAFSDLVNKLNLPQKLILIGHSDGGTIALEFAALHTEKVAGVITEAAHVFLEEISLQGIRDTVEKYKNSNLKDLLARYHGNKTDSIFYRWADTWLSAGMRDWDIRPELRTITAPVLIIQGTDDEYGTEEQLDGIIRNLCSYSEKLMVPGCGHVPHHQQRALITDRMITFIKTHCLV